jgi:ubiquinone/menaquinone biosynthesis C-methylase UbiE
MTKETKEWWEYASKNYQKECDIPVDIHYGPGSPNEKHFKLLGNVKGKKVTEIGCGGAQCSIAFAKRGAIVTGIDISEEQLKFARALAEKNGVQIKFHQGDIRELPQMESSSQDVVFSAFALLYVDDLHSCFKEVYRILVEGGLFVFSLDHPFSRTVDSQSLKLKSSYFDIGKYVRTFADPTKEFVMYNHSVSELFNTVIDSGLSVEKMIEPDSRERYEYDPWYGLWDYSPELLKLIPPTIIFKCRKR